MLYQSDRRVADARLFADAKVMISTMGFLKTIRCKRAFDNVVARFSKESFTLADAPIAPSVIRLPIVLLHKVAITCLDSLLRSKGNQQDRASMARKFEERSHKFLGRGCISTCAVHSSARQYSE